MAYYLARKSVWPTVKRRLREEGAVNRVYDPDLDGSLGSVSVEGLKLADGEKIYFGSNNKYSLRYDPSRGGFVIRDEERGVDIACIKG